MANSARLGLTASLCQDLLPGGWQLHEKRERVMQYLIGQPDNYCIYRVLVYS